MNKFRYLLLIVTISLFACDSDKPQGAVSANNGIINIDIIEASKDIREFGLNNLVKDVEFIVLESIAASYFKSARALQVTDNYILIACSKRNYVFLFERSGKFLRIIGKQGRGPGEYLHPWFASIDPREENVFICESSGARIYKYDIKGQFIKQQDYFEDLGSYIHGSPVFFDDMHFGIPFRRPTKQMNDWNSVVVFDQDLQIVDKMIGRPNDDKLCLDLLLSNKLKQGQNGLISWEGFTNTAYTLNFNKEAKPTYQFSVGENNYSLEYLSRKDHNTDQFEFSFLIDVIDFPKILLVRGYVGEPVEIIYDKKKKEAFSVVDPFDCFNPEYESWFSKSWKNDVFGLEPIGFKHYNPSGGFIATMVSHERVQRNTDLNCLRLLDVKLPKKRDQLADMIENYTGEELPILILMHLK